MHRYSRLRVMISQRYYFQYGFICSYGKKAVTHTHTIRDFKVKIKLCKIFLKSIGGVALS